MTALRRVHQKSGAALTAFPLLNTWRFPNIYPPGLEGSFETIRDHPIVAGTSPKPAPSPPTPLKLGRANNPSQLQEIVSVNLAGAGRQCQIAPAFWHAAKYRHPGRAFRFRSCQITTTNLPFVSEGLGEFYPAAIIGIYIAF
jgi:hypothetical protein